MTQDTSGAQGSTTTAGAADPGATPPAPAPFDPTEHVVADVISYLEQADDAERARVLEAEAARGDKARSTVTGWTPKPADPPAGGDGSEPAAQPAQVAPKQYTDPAWQIGQAAPGAVHRVYSDAGELGALVHGDLKPGQRGVYVVQSGNKIDRVIRADLDRG